MKKTILKQGVLGAAMAVAMMGVSSAAQAESYTYYCVPTAVSNETTNVATYFPMTVENPADACDIGCKNEWTSYLKGNYEKHYKLDTQVIAYDRLSEAKEYYNNAKAFARKLHQPFHHATHFRCSGD